MSSEAGFSTPASTRTPGEIGHAASNDDAEQPLGELVLAIYLGGLAMLWPAECLVLKGGRWQVMEIAWLVEEEGRTPNADVVFQPFNRDDVTALVNVWRLQVFLGSSTDTLGEMHEPTWMQVGPITKQSCNICVGWVVDKLQEIGHELPPLGGGWYEVFISVPNAEAAAGDAENAS